MSIPTNNPLSGRPAHEIRIGSVKASIWKNQTEHGPRYNVGVTRLYKDGNTWKNADSFGRDELLVLAKVVDKAHTWIWRQEQAVNQ